MTRNKKKIHDLVSEIVHRMVFQKVLIKIIALYGLGSVSTDIMKKFLSAAR